MEFESVPFDGEQWDCSLGIEWLTFPIRRWRDLDGMSLARAHSRSLLECSLYLFEEHHWARLNRLEMKEVSPGIFEVDFAAIADVDDGSGLRRFEVSGRCDVKFIGIIVVPDNLDPKPETAEAAATTVAHFLALDDLDEPRSEQWRFVLDPST